MKILMSVFVALAGWAMVARAGVALNVVSSAPTGEALLRNGSFELLRDGRPADWRAWQNGFQVAAGQGRSNSIAIVCENPDGKAEFGASQTLTLNRTSTAPLVVRGWSKAENVSGSTDAGYSIYVDLVYADGTPLWGQTANFPCGTHDWQGREIVILPEKPVQSLSLHCLFRGHTGKVWFDDVSLVEVKTDGGAVLFQGVPVAPVTGRWPGVAAGRETPAATNGFFLVRDVAANSDFHTPEEGTCAALDLKLNAAFEARANHTVVRGRLTSTSAKDRAVTLVFALPLDATGWRWGDDIRRSRIIRGQGEYAHQVAVRCGATGSMSLYPLAPVWNERAGLALALDMAQPAVYRLGYHAGLKLLFIAYDFGLAPDTERCPNSAEFRFVIYRFDPAEGFRSAFQRFMEIFPDHFAVRSKEHGLWMPFTDVSTVRGWEDFGFRYHEGNNNVPWDDAHGVLSFRYTEPMTWWMRMKKGTPRTLAAALAVREELARGTDVHQRRYAEVSRRAAMFDETGQPALQFRDTPWCDGAVWSLNPSPFLGATSGPPRADGPSEIAAPLNAATLHWNETVKQQLYGPAARGRLDGEYLDSLEGYVTADLNFRREHFRCTTVPLAFAPDTRQPALFKGLAVFEFTRWISDDVHRLGKLMFANGVPYRFTFLCPWLDVLGTETDWLRAGQYRPASLPTMDLWRTMSGAKPYLLLMNTDYDRFTPDLVEKYFHRCLFYGMWPGFFSHNASENPYWQNPKWYDRDRPLFKKFIPVIKRVSEAGWRPVTGASCDNTNVLVERFGPGAGGEQFFTLFNDTAQPQSGLLLLKTDGAFSARELLSGRMLERAGAGWRVSLRPHEAAVVQPAVR